jgi:MerR family transcriptional regulator/heat shock protein HspR
MATPSVTPTTPLYMIGVAAELAGMHPQTLRIYERRGLVEPRRTAGNTRLYSLADVERLRRIQQLTTEVGLNLSGVEQVLGLEDQVARLERRVARLEAERAERERAHRAALDAQRRAMSREVVVRSHSTALVPLRRPRTSSPAPTSPTITFRRLS